MFTGIRALRYSLLRRREGDMEKLQFMWRNTSDLLMPGYMRADAWWTALGLCVSSCQCACISSENAVKWLSEPLLHRSSRTVFPFSMHFTERRKAVDDNFLSHTSVGVRRTGIPHLSGVLSL